MEKSFYIAVIAILGTGVWDPTQGRTSDGRDWGEEDEVSLTTASWGNHRNSRRDQVQAWQPPTTSQCLQQSHVAMITLLTFATVFTQDKKWRHRQDVMMAWQG